MFKWLERYVYKHAASYNTAHHWTGRLVHEVAMVKYYKARLCKEKCYHPNARFNYEEAIKLAQGEILEILKITDQDALREAVLSIGDHR